jgi:hypothetical protein
MTNPSEEDLRRVCRGMGVPDRLMPLIVRNHRACRLDIALEADLRVRYTDHEAALFACRVGPMDPRRILDLEIHLLALDVEFRRRDLNIESSLPRNFRLLEIRNSLY